MSFRLCEAMCGVVSAFTGSCTISLTLNANRRSMTSPSSRLTLTNRVSSLNMGERSLMLVHITCITLHYFLPTMLFSSQNLHSINHIFGVQCNSISVEDLFMQAVWFHGYLILSPVTETCLRKTSHRSGSKASSHIYRKLHISVWSTPLWTDLEKRSLIPLHWKLCPISP